MPAPFAKFLPFAFAFAALALAACKWEIPNNSDVELAPSVRLGEVAPPPAAGRIAIARAPVGGRVAYILATPIALDHELQHIFIDDGNRTWEVFGLPYAGKPLDNLHWEGDDSHALVFDRWFSATQGVRVYLDIQTGGVFYAMPLNREAPATRP
jgi:hypothetical protein